MHRRGHRSERYQVRVLHRAPSLHPRGRVQARVRPQALQEVPPKWPDDQLQRRRHGTQRRDRQDGQRRARRRVQGLRRGGHDDLRQRQLRQYGRRIQILRHRFGALSDDSVQPRQQDAQEDDVALRPSALGVAPEHHPHREGDAATHGRVPRRDGAGRQQVPVVSLLGSGADASYGLVQEAPGEDLVLLPEVSPQLAPPVDFLGPARARTVRTGAGERRRDGGGARDNPASQLRGQRRGRRGPIRHPHPRAHVHRSVHQRHLSQSAPRQHVRPRLLLQHVRGGSASLTPRRSHDRGESDAVQVDQPYPRRVQGHLRGGGGAARARAFRGTAGAFRQRRATERHLSPRSRPRGGARILHVHLGGARHGKGREGVRGWRRGRARTGRSRMGAKVEREGGGGGGARLAR